MTASGAVTERPWRADHNYISAVSAKVNVQIAKCGGDLSDKAMVHSHARWRADAAHIVRCVNAFDALVHALEMVRDANRDEPHIPPTALAAIDAALATGATP